ncbi:hypothetical protein ISCGN_024649, partial [Ixodes scapularis]
LRRLLRSVGSVFGLAISHIAVPSPTEAASRWAAGRLHPRPAVRVVLVIWCRRRFLLYGAAVLLGGSLAAATSGYDRLICSGPRGDPTNWINTEHKGCINEHNAQSSCWSG